MVRIVYDDVHARILRDLIVMRKTHVTTEVGREILQQVLSLLGRDEAVKYRYIRHVISLRNERVFITSITRRMDGKTLYERPNPIEHKNGYNKGNGVCI